MPLWGAISLNGFQEIVVHRSKKLTVDEWAGVVRSGKLTAAARKLQPGPRSGPWKMLCDNEKFLKSKPRRKEYKAKSMKMIHIPQRSLDLNPIEQFWSHLRRELRRKDNRDLLAKRAPLGKMAYRARVRATLRSRKMQNVAKACAARFLKTCKKVVKNRGAHSGD